MNLSFPPRLPISPIKVSTNGRYFVDRDGKPEFWLGDTQWELFRLFTPDTAVKILEDRKSKGFNILLIMLTGVGNGWEPSTEKQAPYTNVHGDQPWIENDPLQPNERYFQHIDSLIRLGEKFGQTFVVGIYHQWHENTIPVQKARPWARWVAHHYRDVPNLIWSMYPKAHQDFLPVCRELAAGLQEGDSGAHLICVHPDPSVSSSSFIHDEPWLAFNMIQTCVDYDQIYPMVTADYLRTPVKPVIMAEGGYEGLEFDKLQIPHHIRKQAYWTQLSGGHHVYGHNESWLNPLELDSWLVSPGSQHLKVFKDILTSLEEWWTLVPDQSAIVSGAGLGYNLNVAGRAGSFRWLVVYLSEKSTITIDLDSMKSIGRVMVDWIDLKDGNRFPAESHTTEDMKSFSTPPDWEDALLLFQAK